MVEFGRHASLRGMSELSKVQVQVLSEVLLRLCGAEVDTVDLKSAAQCGLVGFESLQGYKQWLMV